MARLYFECGSRSFHFNDYIEIRKKRFKISSHFESRKATPKMGVGAVVIAKVNEAWRLPPFWGQETTPKTEAALCVFLKVLLGIRKRNLIICKRKFLNSGLNPLLAKCVSLSAIQDT